MKLQRAHIHTFRSIVDSGEIDFEDRLSVVIGKNEQGKTTFLKAIASFDPNYAYTPSDLPNHMSARLEERPRSEIPIATLWFTPTLEDQRKLKDIIPSMGNLKSFKATKYYDNH